MLDTPSGGLKNFDTNSDVVYGKFQNGVDKTEIAKPEPSRTPESEPDFYSDEILTPEDGYDDQDDDDDEYPEVEHEDEYLQSSDDLQLLRKTLDLSTDQQKQKTHDKQNDREVRSFKQNTISNKSQNVDQTISFRKPCYSVYYLSYGFINPLLLCNIQHQV